MHRLVRVFVENRREAILCLGSRIGLDGLGPKYEVGEGMVVMGDSDVKEDAKERME